MRMPRIRPGRRLALLLALAAFLVPATSAHGAAWVAPGSVGVVNGRTDGPPSPQIGVDSGGNATLATTAGKGGSNFAVQVATRPAGGSWTTLQELGMVP